MLSFSLALDTFQPTLPARGATRHRHAAGLGLQDFNPRSPHGERQPSGGQTRRRTADFNPRSPHGERPRAGDERGGGKAFQPTLPARGATGAPRPALAIPTKFQPTLPARGATPGFRPACASRYFNPRSPHGERHQRIKKNAVAELISTHAPRTGSDKSSRRRTN